MFGVNFLLVNSVEKKHQFAHVKGFFEGGALRRCDQCFSIVEWKDVEQQKATVI